MASIYTQQSNNILRTIALMTSFLVIVISLGWLMAYYFNSPIILYFAIGFSLVMNLISYFKSDKIALNQTGAMPANPILYNELHNIVENLAITAGLPKPAVYVINDQVPNAFATGRNPKNSSIAVSTGLLEILEPAELQGVIAHEMSHIGNRDILVMTVAVVLAGFISLIGDFFIRGNLFSSEQNDNNKDPRLFVLLIIFNIFAPILAYLLQMAVSRQREYLADSTGALLTRYPEGLASALEKISQYNRPMKRASKATAHLFIANPFSPANKIKSFFSTHPPIDKRIKILRDLNN